MKSAMDRDHFSIFSFQFHLLQSFFSMGLAEPSPAPSSSLAQAEKMSDAEDIASPFPVSSCGAGLASPAKKDDAKEVDNDADANADGASGRGGEGEDYVNFRGRDLGPVGHDPLAAAAAAASAKISETAHRAAELTLGALGASGAAGTATADDLVRASRESLWAALGAARSAVAGAVAAAAQASDAAVEGTRQQYHAVVSAVEAAKEAASNSNASALESFKPGDGSAVLGAFSACLCDEIVSSTSSSSSSSSSSFSLFPPAPRTIRGALFVTSSSVQFRVSSGHQALGRAVSRAVSASAAEASAASLGSGSSELGGFLGATLSAEDAERAAREAEKAAGLPEAGTVAVIPLAEIEKVEVVEESNGEGRNSLVVSVKGGGSGKVTFAAFGAPSDADEALALVEHLMAEAGKE